MIEAPRLLFVPVSGPFGMGEYARCAALANAATARWSRSQVHFLLSRAAPYAANAPFQATLLDSSPTHHTREVCEFIEDWRPDAVIFDNAGRSAQLAAAQRAGARVVYISARRRQRAKAFRIRWMHIIDEHWIAYPEFVAGSLGVIERAKLAWLRRPAVRYLDVILSSGAAPQASSEPDVLVIPGGGTGHPGAARAVDEFRMAARALAARGFDVLFVGPPPVDDHRSHQPHFTAQASLPQSELAALMGNARLIVANGGSTLLQGIASGAACVGIAIAADQAERLRRCVAAGVARAAPLDAAAIEREAFKLLSDAGARKRLVGRAAAFELRDGIAVAMDALEALLAGSSAAGLADRAH